MKLLVYVIIYFFISNWFIKKQKKPTCFTNLSEFAKQQRNYKTVEFHFGDFDSFTVTHFCLLLTVSVSLCRLF